MPVGRPMNATEMVPGEWDRVVIAGGYADDQVIESLLGFPWDSAKTGIRSSEGRCLLMLVKGKEVVDWAMVNRRRADFCPSAFDSKDSVPRNGQFVRKTPDRSFPAIVGS